MANTNYLKNEVEQYVRDTCLIQRFSNQHFSKQTLQLTTGGKHEFDAVSTDKSIIVGIKTNSGKTRGGKPPAGKYAELFQELYFLTLVRAPKKLLVLTNEEMFKAFLVKSQGKVPADINITFCKLPLQIMDKVKSVQSDASVEQGKK